MQVYMQAVMWLCTGDDLYARNAATILWAWAGTNKSFSGQNAPLVSAQRRRMTVLCTDCSGKRQIMSQQRWAVHNLATAFEFPQEAGWALASM